MTRLHDLASAGQSAWYDHIHRALLNSGELQKLIYQGVMGVNSNPSIFERDFLGRTDYAQALERLSAQGFEAAAYEALILEDIAAGAGMFRPTYDRTHARDRYISLEVRAPLAHNIAGTVEEAHRLFRALNRTNIMIKVPATAEGIDCLESLIAGGINVNKTLIFSVETYREVAGTYLRGLERRAEAGQDLGAVASVASLFISRIDTAAGREIERKVLAGEVSAQDFLGKTAIANTRLAYGDFKRISSSARFDRLNADGARVQRPLWASTSTKSPQYRDVLYIEKLIAEDTVSTIPPATLAAFLDHGRRASFGAEEIAGSREILGCLADAGISLKAIARKLQKDGVRAFMDSYKRILANIERKQWRPKAGSARRWTNFSRLAMWL